MSIADVAKKHALLNAAKFEGRASLKAVIGKVMAEVGDAARSKDVIPIIREVVEEVNRLSLEEQQREMHKLGITLEKKKGEKRGLPPLPHAVKGEVVTRFPPEPNGYLHIGHAKAAFVDYEYARMYDGIFILRFDDTNPTNESREFYDIQKEDLRWLGIEWDREYRTSDNLPKHYELAQKLLETGHAYVCTCSEQQIKENRRTLRECACRNEGTHSWDDFIAMKEGEASVRLNGNMKSLNTAMRDPILFRIIEDAHPVHGTRYRVWPTYDFYGAVEDSLSGVTHPFRSKEYELRDEVYFYLLECLGLRKPHLMEFSRLEIQGMPVSKRKIKPLIEQRKVMGWDDPRLPTLRGLQRRGISVEAIKEFVLSQGISKSESIITFENLEGINRRILDARARRYFFVPDPVKVVVANAVEKELVLHAHPSVDMGTRTLRAGRTFHIPREDAQKLAPGDVFRLKDLYNVRVIDAGRDVIQGEFAGTELLPGTEKIQWVSDDYVSLTVLVPSLLYIRGKFNEKSLTTVEGYAEKNIQEVPHGQVVQFERFGFVRIERQDGLKGIFAHQ